jgi:hypothetical protein
MMQPRAIVLLGNSTYNTYFNNQAIKEINLDIQLSPKQSIYQALLEDLE